MSGRPPRVPISNVVAVCASRLEFPGDVNVFTSKVGTSALRETLPNTCQEGLTSQRMPPFGVQRSNTMRPD